MTSVALHSLGQARDILDREPRTDAIGRRLTRGVVTLDDLRRRCDGDTAAGCWFWEGPVNASGYGVVWFGGKNMLAHRVAWLLSGRANPGALSLCHQCDIPRCINPEHLFPGSPADNAADRNSKGRSRGGRDGRRDLKARTACVHGHEYTAENTGRHSGRRYCRTCKRLASRARRGKVQS